jgi:hypothetical protein
MSKYFCFSLLIFFFLSANAQNDIIISGTILDVNTQLPVELATVYLSTVKDSSVIDYTVSDKKGNFKFVSKKINKPVFLKVSNIGYKNFLKEFKEVYNSIPIGNIYMEESQNLLKEVVIKTQAPPIRVKKDTLEFNAPSFKVRPDATVEALLKQLPGFLIDSDGVLTVNGKVVTEVLINGKPFFDRDGALILKNLPAELIQKVQVMDYKTKKEEMSKQEASSDNSRVNLTIVEEKNKGMFGKFLAGYGTDDRYETSFITNFFDNNRKISLLASSNNVNSTGFSMDEVFDNMGGGRNSSGRTSGTTGKGITTSNLFGINYVDELFKDFESSSSYNFSNISTENATKAKQVSFLPEGSFLTESDSKSKSERTENKLNFELEYDINPQTRIVYVPKYNQSNSTSSSMSSSFSTDENSEALNESTSQSNTENSSQAFSNAINFNKSFEKRARNLSVSIDSDNNGNEVDVLNKAKTIFYQNNIPDDIRDQKRITDNDSDSYSAEIEYTEPITDSLRVRVGGQYNWRNNISDLKTYDFDTLNQSYTTENDMMSNFTTSKRNAFSQKLGVTFEKNKFTFNFNSGASIIQYDNHSLYLDKATDLNKKYIIPIGTASIRYRVGKTKSVSFRYDYNLNLPSANQLLPVLNLANPLNTFIGNPDLNPSERHGGSLFVRNFDMRTRSGYEFYVRGDFYTTEVVSFTVYNANRKANTTYKNVSDTYSTSLGGSWNKSIKKEANLFRFGLGLNANVSLSKGFTNTVLYDAKSLRITPRVFTTYEYGELLIVSPSYNFTFDETNYSNSGIKASSTIVHRANLQVTNYWPTNWIFGNDFGYTYNSNLAPGFKKDFFLWNTSLSYTFLEKRLMAKLKVYDVLDQNQSNGRNISATSIRDEENIVLKRYAMFSLTYKMDQFGGVKEKPTQGEGRGDREGGRGRDGGDRRYRGND